MSENKVTYITLTADNEGLHRCLDKAIAEVKGQLGKSYPIIVAGQRRMRETGIERRSPADDRVLVGRFSSAGAQDVQDAVAAAKAAFPAWRATPWQRRAEIIERAANLVRERSHELAAWLVLENGKNRVEALGEVEETADLYAYYAEQLRLHGGFIREMGRLSASDANTSVLRPFGVWAVISPWNFPFALLGAPAAAALVTGNTVVMKPSSDTPMSAVLLTDIFLQAGVPAGAIHLLTGSGRIVGNRLVEHPDVAGLTFTGSYDVGFKDIYRRFSERYPKPCIVEMGGKNPAIVMDSADLDRAVQGIYRSAFGMDGQKCSACSRVYLHRSIREEFLRRFVKLAEATRIGDPLDQHTFMGPLSVRSGYEDYQRFVATGRQDGRIVTGGECLTQGEYAHGFFVRPTLIDGLPEDHELMKKELFVPILCAQTVDGLDEGLERANDTVFGLTAGLFSSRAEEIDVFLDRIEAGVIYVNRAAGATTGAWPGVQPFGGWKGSGSTGKNIGGLYTIQCYLREQSRTLTT